MNLLGLISSLKSTSPIVVAVFFAVLLGGVALSFFWKYFGPWQQLAESQRLLEECRQQLNECHADASIRFQENARISAEFADLKARYSVLMEAMARAGVVLLIGDKPKI